MRITREMILDAALELVREEGHERLSARNLADRLQCSTQPLLYQFESVEAIRRAAYAREDEAHTAYIMDLQGEYDHPMLEIGMRYIRFAAEEPQLFRFLFQSDGLSGQSLEELIAAPEAAPLLEAMSRAAGVDAGRAATLFEALFVAVHGYASLLANNGMRWDPDAAARTLGLLWDGMFSEGTEEEK